MTLWIYERNTYIKLRAHQLTSHESVFVVLISIELCQCIKSSQAPAPVKTKTDGDQVLFVLVYYKELNL